MGTFDFFKSSSKKRWINVQFGVSVDKDVAGVTKRKLILYTEDLGWEIITSKEKEEPNRIDITLLPKERGDTRMLSPSEFKSIRRKLNLFGEEIPSELGISNLTRSFSVSITKAMNVIDSCDLYHRTGLLTISYDIKERIELEKENLELAKELFGETVKSFIKDLSEDKKMKKGKVMKEWLQKVRKILKMR